MRFWLLVLVFVAGAAVLLVGFTWALDDLIWSPLAVVGAATMGYVVVVARRSFRQLKEDLIAGKDVIARWQLSQADLDAFHVIDRERTGAGAAYWNLLSIPKTAPLEGVPIIIGQNDWVIGTRLYRGSPPGGTLKCCVVVFHGDPGFIETAVVDRSSGAGYFMRLARVPVPIAARAAAQSAGDALAARLPPSNFERLKRTFPDYLSNVASQLRREGRLT